MAFLRQTSQLACSVGYLCPTNYLLSLFFKDWMGIQVLQIIEHQVCRSCEEEIGLIQSLLLFALLMWCTNRCSGMGS